MGADGRILTDKQKRRRAEKVSRPPARHCARSHARRNHAQERKRVARAAKEATVVSVEQMDAAGQAAWFGQQYKAALGERATESVGADRFHPVSVAERVGGAVRPADLLAAVKTLAPDWKESLCSAPTRDRSRFSAPVLLILTESMKRVRELHGWVCAGASVRSRSRRARVLSPR